MMDTGIHAQGYEKALEMLKACSTPDGFIASPAPMTNYHRVWGRDGAIMLLAALLTDEAELHATCRRTLETLAAHQGPHGEIPSNVDPGSGRISYGGTTGRVDADLWFLIGCGEYWKATGDNAFLERMLPVIEKVRFLLGAWEFNNRGLIYVPQTGDWADEYLHHGYVLYDQILYLQALRSLSTLHFHLENASDHVLTEKISRLRHLIRANYWFDRDAESLPDDVYHDVLYRKGRDAASPHCAGHHWMSFFSPTGYGYRFDSFANILASLTEVADERQRDAVDKFVDSEALLSESLPLLPAFHPVIEPLDEDWKDLNMTFSYTFKNRPHEYHNGGLWPVISGFYVADLAYRGRQDRAAAVLEAIHRANAMEMEGEPWGFPEFVHGTRLTPGGTRHLGWSAAGAVIGDRAMQGRTVLRIDDHDAVGANGAH